MSAVIIEIRAAEGGADARDLVHVQFSVYCRYCERHDLDVEILDERPGLIVAEVNGRHVGDLFRLEPGGHRWQRVPPTEKRGRRHTSTVTVAVLPVASDRGASISERDIEWKATLGSGNGGQARNKTSSCVQMKHKPTGISVRVESERSQLLNRESAFRLLSARIAELEQSGRAQERSSERRQQLGSGQRGDKIRTVRLQDDSVVDHQTGKRTSAGRYLRGFVDDLV